MLYEIILRLFVLLKRIKTIFIVVYQSQIYSLAKPFQMAKDENRMTFHLQPRYAQHCFLPVAKKQDYEVTENNFVVKYC